MSSHSACAPAVAWELPTLPLVPRRPHPSLAFAALLSLVESLPLPGLAQAAHMLSSPVMESLSTASAARAMGSCWKFWTPARTVHVRATAVPTVPSRLGLWPLPSLADSSSVGLSPPGPSLSRVLTVAPSLLSVGNLVGIVSWRQSLARSAGLFWQSP